MLPFHSSARVDSLLALSPSPEYMEGFEMTNSTFVRYIQDEKDSPDVHILEMAGNKKNHFFVWSLSLPKANSQLLSGKSVAGDDTFNCTRGYISKQISMQEALTEEEFKHGGFRVEVLDDTQEMKAWHVKVHERFNFIVESQVNLTKYSNPL